MFKRICLCLLVYLPLVILLAGFIETTSGLNQKGTKLYEQKRYESALDAYRKAQIKSPDNSTIRYNLGTTLYQLDQFQEAESQLQVALAHSDTKDLKATAWYNYGNAQYRLGQFDKAIEAYKETLELNPDDKDAKFNLELLQKKKSIFESKQNKRESQKKQPPQSQKQQQQQAQGGRGKDRKETAPQGKGDQEQSQPQEQGEEEQRKADKEEQSEEDQTPEDEQQEESELEQQQPGKQEQPMSPARVEPGQEEQKPEAGQEEQKPAPILQGQMSKENALRILNALREAEQELQLLRRPRKQLEHEPLKDW